MKGKCYAAHRCPRCQDWTTEKFYCKPCVCVLKKPGRLAGRFHGLVTKWERTSGGWNATALGLVVAVVLSLVLAGPARAWTWGDTARQAVFLGAHAGNYFLVTENIRDAAKYDDYGMTEHPSVGEVGTYFAVSAAAHTLIAVALDQLEDKSYLHGWQYVGIGAQVGVAAYGLALGVNLKY